MQLLHFDRILIEMLGFRKILRLCNYAMKTRNWRILGNSILYGMDISFLGFHEYLKIYFLQYSLRGGGKILK